MVSNRSRHDSDHDEVAAGKMTMDENFTEPEEDPPDFSALVRLPDDQLLPQLVALSA